VAICLLSSPFQPQIPARACDLASTTYKRSTSSRIVSIATKNSERKCTVGTGSGISRKSGTAGAKRLVAHKAIEEIQSVRRLIHGDLGTTRLRRKVQFGFPEQGSKIYHVPRIVNAHERQAQCRLESAGWRTVNCPDSLRGYNQNDVHISAVWTTARNTTARSITVVECTLSRPLQVLSPRSATEPVNNIIVFA